MKREFTYAQSVRRSLVKTYRKSIWNAFVEACKNYRLVSDGDRILLFLENDGASILLSLLFEQLKRVSETDFEYSVAAHNAQLSRFEIEAKNVAGFDEAVSYAKENGYNRLAVTTNLNDVVNTVITGLFRGSQIMGILPKEAGDGLEIIRPLFCIYERDIEKWMSFNSIELEANLNKDDEAARLVEEIKKVNPYVEHNAFTAIHNVKLDTINGYYLNGEAHSFLEKY